MEQQSEVNRMSNDLISRQVAISFVDCGYLRPPTELAWSDKDVVDMLKRLPSAQPKRIKGRWIHDGYDIPHGVDWMHCSVCGRREPHVPAAMTNFCPTCGSDMRGEDDAVD